MAEGSGVKSPPIATGAAAAAQAELSRQVGQEVHVSDWLTITQDRIDAFAAATDDPQWIHVDPVRAKAESPYGGTIAHGYLTLSLQIPLRGMVSATKPFLPGAKNVVNYGLNKLRFPNAVKAGAKIRGRFSLVSVEVIAANALQITETYTVEIEGEAKPGCVAESVIRVAF
jgi:acyl dehydratase